MPKLKALGVCPLPCGRTIERVPERNGLTSPRVRLAPLLPRQEYPAGKPGSSNQLHQVDPVGAFYLKGAATASPTGWARTPWTPSMAASALRRRIARAMVGRMQADAIGDGGALRIYAPLRRHPGQAKTGSKSAGCRPGSSMRAGDSLRSKGELTAEDIIITRRRNWEIGADCRKCRTGKWWEYGANQTRGCRRPRHMRRSRLPDR